MRDGAIRCACSAYALVVISACVDRQTHDQTDTSAGAAPATPVLTAARVPDASRETITPASDTATSPAEIVRRYYDAIQKRDYDAAYALWGDSGKSNGQTREAFAAGFAQTAEVRAAVADSVRIEGAAGSQYATVPVSVDAVLRSGAKQHFTGTYTLRRAMVDGATLEQRRWHIYSADVRPR